MSNKPKNRSRKKKTLGDFSALTVVLGLLAGYLAVNIFFDFLENTGITFFSESFGIWAIVIPKLMALAGVLLLIYIFSRSD